MSDVILNYLEPLSDDEIIDIVNESTKVTLDDDSPLRIACCNIFNEFSAVYLLGVLGGCAYVLSTRLKLANLLIDDLEIRIIRDSGNKFIIK